MCKKHIPNYDRIIDSHIEYFEGLLARLDQQLKNWSVKRGARAAEYEILISKRGHIAAALRALREVEKQERNS